jgi:hypothetical protein
MRNERASQPGAARPKYRCLADSTIDKSVPPPERALRSGLRFEPRDETEDEGSYLNCPGLFLPGEATSQEAFESERTRRRWGTLISD